MPTRRSSWRSRTSSPPRRCQSCSTISAARSPTSASNSQGFLDPAGAGESGQGLRQDLQAAYRLSKNGPDYPDAAPFAKALIAANSERIIWGSDWPHPNSSSGKPATELTPLYQIDDGRLFNQLPVWAPDAAIRKKILVDNPVKLYGF